MILLRERLSMMGLIEKEGYLNIPPWVKRIRIDVGLSSNAPHSALWIAQDDELLVFGFEPNKVNIEMLSIGGSTWPTVISPDLIGEKLIILPFAAQNISGVVQNTFFATSVDSGQSSTKRPKDIIVSSTYSVECCNLAEFISLIPEDRFPIIEYVKTDCQGSDFEILESLAPVLHRIACYTLEIEISQYEHTHFSLTDVKIFFQNHGFKRMNFFNRLVNGVHGELFDVCDPTFFNPTHIAYINKARARFIQTG